MKLIVKCSCNFEVYILTVHVTCTWLIDVHVNVHVVCYVYDIIACTLHVHVCVCTYTFIHVYVYCWCALFCSENKGGLCLSEALAPSEYSYLNPSVLSTWAGPLHWKVKAKSMDRKIIECEFIKNACIK